MPDFRYRSYQKELLDGDDIALDDLRQNLKELRFINRYLGGHRLTITGLKMLIQQCSGPCHIVEIGSGGGDNLAAIQRWASSKKLEVKLTGIDINPHCIDFARQQHDGIEWICSDFRSVVFDQKPDIVFCSLFAHHFTDEQLIALLQWMCNQAALGFFINDLHRHPLAYYAIKFLTRIFSKSRLVKNDAPLSVLRSFTRHDWQRLSAASGVKFKECRWRWAFRWLVISC